MFNYLSSQFHLFQPIMVYNNAVTKLNVYVVPNVGKSGEEVKAAVSQQLDKMIKEWTISTCPTLARVATPPITFIDVHAGLLLLLDQSDKKTLQYIKTN